MSVQNIALDNMSRVSRGLPEDVKVAIADVVIAFSFMDSAAEQLIWQLCGLSFDDGRLLTTMEARPKFNVLKQLVVRHKLTLANPALPDSFWESMDKLREYRNQVAHGQWAMVDEKIPVTASFRIIDKQTGAIIADAFSIERLEAIARQCERCFDYLGRLGLAHQEQLAQSSARPPASEPSPFR